MSGKEGMRQGRGWRELLPELWVKMGSNLNNGGSLPESLRQAWRETPEIAKITGWLQTINVLAAVMGGVTGAEGVMSEALGHYGLLWVAEKVAPHVVHYFFGED